MTLDHFRNALSLAELAIKELDKCEPDRKWKSENSMDSIYAPFEDARMVLIAYIRKIETQKLQELFQQASK